MLKRRTDVSSRLSNFQSAIVIMKSTKKIKRSKKGKSSSYGDGIKDREKKNGRIEGEIKMAC